MRRHCLLASARVLADACSARAVERCEPMVPDVGDLIDALNSSNDFSAFVRKMRREFKKLAQ